MVARICEFPETMQRSLLNFKPVEKSRPLTDANALTGRAAMDQREEVRLTWLRSKSVARHLETSTTSGSGKTEGPRPNDA